jgi:hypothetical protein
MEKPTLFALATVALVNNLGKHPTIGECVDSETGFQRPSGLAEAATGFNDEISEGKHCFDPGFSFDFGFDFGLQLGAAIAEQPERIPDINAIVKATRTDVREFVKDSTDDMGCTLCSNAQKAAAA